MPLPGSFVLAGNLALSTSLGAQLGNDSSSLGRGEGFVEKYTVLLHQTCVLIMRDIFFKKRVCEGGWVWVLEGGTKRQEITLCTRCAQFQHNKKPPVRWFWISFCQRNHLHDQILFLLM